MQPIRILHLEDSQLDADLVHVHLTAQGRPVDIHRVDTRADYERALFARNFDLILADYSLPSFDGVSAFKLAHEVAPEIPFIFLSGTLGEDIAVEMLKNGATDYVLKQRIQRLPRSVERALQDAEDRRARQQAESAERQRVEQMRQLTQATLQISKTTTAAETLQVVAEQARFIIGAAECIAWMLPRGERQKDSYAVAFAPLCNHLRKLGYALVAQRIAAVPTRLQSPLHIPIAADSQPVDGVPAARGMLAAPLMGRDDQTLGFLLLVSKHEGEFTTSDESLLLQLAQATAVAIENLQYLEATLQARSEAETANRIKDHFLATLSHELRTPLNAIVGWTQLLRSNMLTPEQTAEGIEVIDRNARVQAKLIEDLLDVSRIISGKLHLELQSVDLVAIIDAVLKTIEPTAAAKEVHVHATLDRNLPAIQGDPARLHQIVWNLLSNAVKFTPRQGKISVELTRHGSQVELSVCDTGEGILPEFLPHVFDRFSQADSSSTKRAYGGLGLGLSIVRQLVELHGGSVTASSDGKDCGAQFTVRLPMALVRTAGRGSASSTVEAAQQTDASVPELTGVRVLVVDDEPDARDLLERVLQRWGAEVTKAASVATALAAVEQMQPNILVSDIGMPHEDGYDLIRRLRSQSTSPRIPAIALTAFAGPEDRKRALLSGFQVHMTKPVDPSELVATVASLLGRM